MAKRDIRLYTVIRENGQIEQFEKPNELSVKQSLVGGCIEFLPYFSRFNGRYCEAFVNSDGIAEGQKPNRYGTAAWRNAIRNKFEDVNWAGCFGPVVIVQTIPKKVASNG